MYITFVQDAGLQMLEYGAGLSVKYDSVDNVLLSAPKDISHEVHIIFKRLYHLHGTYALTYNANG